MIIDRQYLYDLEHVRSDFEIAYYRFKEKSPTADLTEMENKLSLLSGCITHIHQLHEAIGKHDKKVMMQEFTNQKLLAEIIILKRNTP